MLTPLRIAAAIGLIFYFSPLRRAVELPAFHGEPAGPRHDRSAPPPEPSWRGIPDRAGQALLGHLVANALGPDPARHDEEPSGPRDTLDSEDLRPPWRGEAPGARTPSRGADLSARAARGAGEKPRL